MGMSASQARLLSITSRLSDNELRSQTITTAKMSLASRTTAASAAYMDALAATELRFASYDANGTKVTTALTAASLSQYQELKNQYGLVNKSGQILVSERDAINYENSKDMHEFLRKYGVLSEPGQGDMVQVINPDWEVQWGEYTEAWNEWAPKEPLKSDEKYWTVTTSTDNELYQKFLDASADCYSSAMGGSSGCYIHVLAHLLLADIDPNGDDSSRTYPNKLYTTITGESINIGGVDIGYAAINSAGKTPDMRIVSQEVINRPVYCAENEGMKQNLLDVMNNPASTDDEKKVEQLMSNYYLDGNGEPQLKTLAQKCVDLTYILSNYSALGLNYNDDCKPMLLTFQQDMEQAFTERIFDEELFKQDYNSWLEEEPPKPTVDYYIDKEVPKIINKDEGQWYVNLWHRMNGESQVRAGRVDEYGNIVEGGKTDSGLPSYKVLEDGLMNSAEWLQAALNNNSITLERVDFAEKTEVGTGLADCEWNSLIWTSSNDITEEQDDVAITLAEAQYKQTLADIEAKDKQYDNQLKLLDTEHSALQTEYDSIKGVIDKNIERTLKLYS